ncbi:MAG TPA: hypothetical protein VEQ58_09515, partial [Polyangiaceae bacterium]|nr:hypothetical protein [Polyangiaceae bacterium]
LQQLLALEPSVARPPPPRALPSEAVAASAPAPRGLPSHEVPSGMVWPPVEGRILLRDALSTPAESVLDASGDQRATLGTGYRAHSARSARFASVEEARNSLIAWARLHVSAQPLLSKGRCIVLAQESDAACRLWQIVRAEPSLRELFVDGCDTMIPRHAARQLASASRILGEAQSLCQRHGLTLRCTLDTIGVSDAGAPIFVADFPFPAPADAAPLGPEQTALELSRLLAHRSASDRAELCRELLLFQRREPLPSQGARIGELLSQLLTT